MQRAFFVVILLAACPAPSRPLAPPLPAKPIVVAPVPGTLAPGTVAPKLVVLLVVDQLPAWSFTAKRSALTGGFDRLLREGEWYTGHHPSAATTTAPGHSLLGTGEPSSVTGIVGNSWWDRDAQVMVESVRDPKKAVTSAYLRVPALGDAMAAANAARPVPGKAVAVSLKDRASILPLGHAGIPIWYDAKAVAWTSIAPLPWLATYNRSHPIRARLGEVWKPLEPDRIATLSGVVDAAPGELGDEGFGATFPHDPGATKDPALTVYASPLGNELVFDIASAAIDAEGLGTDDVPDLLIVSLSAHDYIGHAWGHESWEAWDALLRADRRLDAFLTELDTKVGAGAWAMIATSDHGASPMPKGLVTYTQIKDAANKAAATELGGGEWIADAHFPSVYLTKAALAAKDRAKAIRKIVFALRSFPGLARVERSGDFAGRCETRTGDAQRLCWTIDPQRSGEIIYIPRAGWIVGPGEEPHATAHGSLNAYDQEVPLILLPPGRTPHAALERPSETTVPMIQIAPMLASWLGITPPATLRR
jgi:type I phosphodiesterase/nucleotide pyrophosphatase